MVIFGGCKGKTVVFRHPHDRRPIRAEAKSGVLGLRRPLCLTHPKKWILGHSEGSFFGRPLIGREDGSVAQEHCPPFPVFINATVWRKSCTHFSQHVRKSLDLKFGSGPHPRRVQNVTCKIAQRPYPHRAILPGETPPLSDLDGIDAGVGQRYEAGTNLWLYGVANFKSSGFNVSIGRTLMPHNGPS
jgi:hypothetical protein